MSAFREGLLEGKTAFIAGGSSGINLGIAEKYASLGAKLAILSRSQDKIDAAIEKLKSFGGEVIGFSADVRDFDAVEAALAATTDEFGTIDILVSGAAGNFLAPAMDLSPNGFKTVVDIDLIGTFNVFRASWDHLTKPGASLIAITAIQAVQPKPFQVHAAAGKSGVNMVSKSLALEWGPAGVRVNLISPGPIENTEGISKLGGSDEQMKRFVNSLALRRMGKSEDIGNAAVFLGSDASSFVTGTVLNVDGGADLGDASVDCLTPFPKRK